MADQLNIPEGVQITASPRGIAIHHSGDILLSGSLGSRIAKVTSTDGNITLRGEQQVEEICSERGSIVLDGDMRIGKVLCLGGNITLAGTIQADEVLAPAGSVALSGTHRIKTVQAAEDLNITGHLRGSVIKGGRVKLNAEKLEVGAVEGTLRVDLGEGAYKVEVVIAPHIEVHPGSEGRINVIESNNELGSSNLKGRFRLAEYAEFTGIDPNIFLRERDVRSLAKLGQPLAVTTRAPADEAPTEQADENLDALLELVPEPMDGAEVIEPGHVGPPISLMPEALEPLSSSETGPETADEEPIAVGEADDASQDAADGSAPFTVGTVESAEESQDTISDTLDATVDEVDPGSEEQAPPDEQTLELQRQIKEQVMRLSGLFRQDEPQGVARLRRYVSTDRYGEVASELQTVFNDVLRAHVQRAQRPHHQVVPTFNRIHSLVSQLA